MRSLLPLAPIAPGSSHTFTVSQETAGMRLDAFLREQFPHYSRTFFSKAINERYVTIQGIAIKKSGTIIKKGDVITIAFPQVTKDIPQNAASLESSGLAVVFQNQDFAVIYKPAGITVHPASERSTAPTLVDWLMVQFANVHAVGYQDRPGIVHRLDKDTSGLMIIPLTCPAFAIFSDLFKDRKIHKTYLALVKGHPQKEGTFDYPIARHQTVRTKMAHHTEGRVAHTAFTTLAHFKETSLIEARPTTGRTHQIRVHFATAGHPLLGDKLYGSNSPFIDRQALHASKLCFMFQGKEYAFEHPLPDDMIKALEKLKNQVEA